MADHIDSLACDRARLRRMSQAGYSFATTQQWKDRALLMERFYRQVLARHDRQVLGQRDRQSLARQGVNQAS
jgi:hypothetical protein